MTRLALFTLFRSRQLDRIEGKLDALPRVVGSLLTPMNRILIAMTDKLDDLLDRIEARDTVQEGLFDLIDSLLAERADLRNQLGEAANDPEQIAAIIAALDTSDAALAAKRQEIADALVVNTPADPAPPADTTTGGQDTV